MSSEVVNLISSIKAKITPFGYTELAYSKDVGKNNFSGNFRRFAVLPGESTEYSGVTRSINLEQTFSIVLTDGFINKPMSDSEEASKGSLLQDVANAIYAELLSSKAGLPNTCISVSNASISEPETLPEQKVVFVKLSFKLKYRKTI